jgi:hypothetical protein
MSGQLGALRRAADARADGSAVNLSTFARNISALLERTEYRRCDKGDDLEDIYRLRYKSYRLSGMVPENPRHVIHDGLDEATNCSKFSVYIDGMLVSTLRIHHVCSATPQSPSTTVYGDILHPRIGGGARFIDPSRFAADPEWSRIYPQIPYLTLRLAGMACFHFDAPYCLSTIRPDHAGFYKRIYSSEMIGDLRNYPGLNYQVVLYLANVHAIEERAFARFPFFKSTPMEQRLMFGKPLSGEPAPLTILPTAKYLCDAA